MGLNRRNARLLSECLESTDAGFASLQECAERFPQIKEALLLAYQIASESKEETNPAETTRKHLIRSRIMQNLPEREELVTNSLDHRYRWQNLKRRFAMSWIIILTTLISLVSGGGVVYASGNALPGEVLYTVKTWVEAMRLAVADEETDAGLHFRFAETRLEEIQALIEAGELEEIEEALSGYENHIKLLTQLMPKIKAHNPDEAVRLRTDLQTKLQEQTRIMEEWLNDAEDSDGQLRERLREMLQTNTQLRERIHEVEEELVEDDAATEETHTEKDKANGSGSEKGSGQGGKKISAAIDGAANTFKFNLGGEGGNGVYAMIAGSRFECNVEGDEAICPAAGAPNKGSLQLFDAKTHQLLFTYTYEYAFDFSHAWQGEKNDNGGNGEPGGGGTSEGEGNQKNNGQ